MGSPGKDPPSNGVLSFRPELAGALNKRGVPTARSGSRH
jgi:hypothetical protein